MCLNGCYLKLESIKVAFLYALNGNSFINIVYELYRNCCYTCFSPLYICFKVLSLKIAGVISTTGKKC